jgi:hypothetical protein
MSKEILAGFMAIFLMVLVLDFEVDTFGWFLYTG